MILLKKIVGGELSMNTADLKLNFIEKKDYEPSTLDELLDFAVQTYIQGKITISEYRNLIRELEAAGATRP